MFNLPKCLCNLYTIIIYQTTIKFPMNRNAHIHYLSFPESKFKQKPPDFTILSNSEVQRLFINLQ